MILILKKFSERSVSAVSYTHLDVYKRQVIVCSQLLVSILDSVSTAVARIACTASCFSEVSKVGSRSCISALRVFETGSASHSGILMVVIDPSGLVYSEA